MSTLSTASQKPAERYARFVAHIKRLCVRDPGSRAALRRGLRRTPSEAMTMHKVVAPWVPDRARDAQEWAYYTVAALIAAQSRMARDEDAAELADAEEDHDADETPDADGKGDAAASSESSEPRRNLGAALAAAVGVGAIRENTAESRLHLLVRQNTPGLHRHLDGVVRHLRADGVAVDWAQLLSDLSRWESYRDQVAKSWLRSFYRSRTAAEFDGGPSGGPSSVSDSRSPEE